VHRVKSPLPDASTLVEILRGRALDQPDRRAYTFLVDGETEEIHLTYGELDRQARVVAATLQDRKAEGERALLLYPPGLDYIAALFGCLYAGVTAVPVYPPDPSRLQRTLPRLQAIAKDSQSKIVLTTERMYDMGNFFLEQAPDLKRLSWLTTDGSTEGTEDGWRTPGLSSEALAVLQYTSGSTGSPKGVMLSHRNLLHNSAQIAEKFGHTPLSQGVIWLPPYHDMGLIGGILQPLCAGFPCTLMSPLHFLQKPIRWLEAVTRYGATTSGGPNFAYELCVRKIPPERRAGLDLSTWEVAFCGAEPIRKETWEKFADAFRSCGFRHEAFYPCYGLAEATLIASGGERLTSPGSFEKMDAPAVIDCGGALKDQKIIIVNPESQSLCLPEQIGEIWISGPSVAQGYWKRPQETQQTFQAYLDDSGEGPFLRTGDLGFLRDSRLFVTGRLKDLIIIGGQNHYPQDIERTVEEAHPAIRPGCSAAFSADIDGQERLIVVAESEENDEKVVIKIVGDIREAIAEQHNLQAHKILLLKRGSIPKTSSGKIQHHVCKDGFLSGNLGAP
jgi:acyl-CoA synthetase (AMP-forming)/AMP-acid ligase II